MSSKLDILVEVDTRKLWASRKWGVWPKHRKALSRGWLALSVWPFNRGCYPVEGFKVAPSTLQNVLQTWDENWELQGVCGGKKHFQFL